MQIRRLTFETNERALELLQLQMTAYRVEAELIGCADLPPLRDSIKAIRSSKELFDGCFESDTLIGAIACETDRDELTISRVMVHPSCFRRGIATALMQHVLTHADPAIRRVYVSTGVKNEPALQLYRKLGFRQYDNRIVGPGVELVTLVRELGK